MKRMPSRSASSADPSVNGSPSTVAEPDRVGLVVAREELDHRGLAGTVLAHECVDLAGGHLEATVGERHLSGEGLDHPGQVEQRLCLLAHG